MFSINYEYTYESNLSHTMKKKKKQIAQKPYRLQFLEEPQGSVDMGGWTRGVYTEEQQKRLGIDEYGRPRQH